MSTRRLIITGRVQGVGYRYWALQQAQSLGISGWVRNLRDGSVEILVDGEIDSVEEIARCCRRGPRLAEVVSVEEYVAEPPEQEGFTLLPTP